MKSSLRKLLWGMMVVVLVQAACNFSTATPTEPPTQPPSPPAEVYPPPFAEYAPITARLPQTFAGGGYSLPLDLGQVQGLTDLELSSEQLALLAENGFVVAAPVPGKYREFYQIYESGRYYTMPLFITTDSVYHVYHLIFDKMLRDLERDYFIADLRALTSALLAETSEQYTALRGAALEEQALRNVAFFGVADRLLGLNDPIPPEAQALVDAELALINAASEPSISPLWDRPDLDADKKTS